MNSARTARKALRKGNSQRSQPRPSWAVFRDSEWPTRGWNADVDESDEPPFSIDDLPLALRWAAESKWGSVALWQGTQADLESFRRECATHGYELAHCGRGSGGVAWKARVKPIAQEPPAGPVVQASMLPGLVRSKIVASAAFVQGGLF